MKSIFKNLILGAVLVADCVAQTSPKAPFESKTIQVMAILRAREGASLEDIRKAMPAEIRATVQLYLDGKITQWYSLSDGRGVVFLLDCKSVEEAKTLLEQLPLVKQNVATLDYTALSPLWQLELLMK